MTVQRLQAHYGFTKMPFGRNLAPSMLHRHPGHGEAVARISWCVDQHALGVITGEVGAGKTVAVRAATTALDTSRHVIIYLPNPSVGVRGMLHHIVATLGQVPSFYTANRDPARPASANPIAANAPCTPILLRACRSVNPGTCSTNVQVRQSTWSQKNRRTVNHTATGRPEMGRSAGCRR